MDNILRLGTVHRHTKARRKAFPRKRICPLRHVSITVCLQIMIKITAADYIISFSVISLHIFIKHGELTFSDLIAAAIGRHMNIVEAKAFSLLHGNSGYRITPVEVHQLTEGFGNGKTPSHGISNAIPGISHNS